MERCDVLIVGGGPAGSTCAWALERAGVDVLVMDAAVFPRDKVCAGWITPQVVSALALDLDDYRKRRTLQHITGFRVGRIGGPPPVETQYGHIISYGIRRSEFDHYLLARSGARIMQGTPLSSLRRDGTGWVVNEAIRTPMVVGAGGQFCPVARAINPGLTSAGLVVAQEAEFPLEPSAVGPRPTPGETPELFFSPDLKGYGWCVRKGAYLNVGLGRLDRQSLPAATREFVALLQRLGKLPSAGNWRWRGHAYAVDGLASRRIVDANVMLVGDAAGIAYPESGEGIRPAIESGLLAARTILNARDDYTSEGLSSYRSALLARFGTAPAARAVSRFIAAKLGASGTRRLLDSPLFVRHVVLDRWFLHAKQPALSMS